MVELPAVDGAEKKGFWRRRRLREKKEYLIEEGLWRELGEGYTTIRVRGLVGINSHTPLRFLIIAENFPQVIKLTATSPIFTI